MGNGAHRLAKRHGTTTINPINKGSGVVTAVSRSATVFVHVVTFGLERLPVELQRESTNQRNLITSRNCHVGYSIHHLTKSDVENRSSHLPVSVTSGLFGINKEHLLIVLPDI